MRTNLGADPFEQQRPENQMRHDFRELGWPIMLAQTEPAMQPDHQRQGAGNQPAIIEMVMEESRMDMRLYQPPIDGVGRAAKQKERVAIILKARHDQSA